EAQQRRRFAAVSTWRGGDRRTELAADERGSDGYCRAVKPRQTETVEDLVVTSSLFFEDPDCNRFAELMRLRCIGAPMYTGDVSTQRHVRGDLVEFAADR